MNGFISTHQQKMIVCLTAKLTCHLKRDHFQWKVHLPTIDFPLFLAFHRLFPSNSVGWESFSHSPHKALGPGDDLEALDTEGGETRFRHRVIGDRVSGDRDERWKGLKG